MGLSNRTGNTTYLSVFNGKITQRVKEHTEGATSRENKNGVIVWELTHDCLSGRLVNIEFRDGDYGKEIHFIVEDGIDTYNLQLPFSSPVAKQIILRLENCDLSEDLEIFVGWDKVKERTFSFIKQGGVTIKQKYTKDEPNGLPEMEKIKVKGKETWDDSEQLEFLEKMLAEKIIPQFGKKVHEQPSIEQDDNDQLPF